MNENDNNRYLLKIYTICGSGDGNLDMVQVIMREYKIKILENVLRIYGC